MNVQRTVMPADAVTFHEMMAVIAGTLAEEMEVTSAQWRMLLAGLQGATASTDVFDVWLNGVRIIAHKQGPIATNHRYVTTAEAAARSGITQRRITALCVAGNVRGARRHGRVWMVPASFRWERHNTGPKPMKSAPVGQAVILPGSSELGGSPR